MRIITMQRLTLDGKPVYSDAPIEKDWWCVIETEEEELFYDKYVADSKDLAGETNAEHIWNEMIRHAGLGMGVKWGDDDVYGYIRPDEDCPDVGENFKDGDGDIWVRID
jgi:hypothetical protein